MTNGQVHWCDAVIPLQQSGTATLCSRPEQLRRQMESERSLWIVAVPLAEEQQQRPTAHSLSVTTVNTDPWRSYEFQSVHVQSHYFLYILYYSVGISQHCIFKLIDDASSLKSDGRMTNVVIELCLLLLFKWKSHCPAVLFFVFYVCNSLQSLLNVNSFLCPPCLLLLVRRAASHGDWENVSQTECSRCDQ